MTKPDITAFALVGMVHLKPLFRSSGSPDIDAVEEAALADALALHKAGFNRLMIENFGDAPFFPDQVEAHTVAAMARIAHSISGAVQSDEAPPILGINVLRNDANSALGIAAAIDAGFIRVNVLTGAMVTDQGLIQGKAHEVIRYRDQVAPNCEVWADVRVKHAAPLAERPIGDEAFDLWSRGGADAIIVSGSRTGTPLDPTELDAIRAVLPDARIIAGSGVTPDQLTSLIPRVDGIIVGSWTKQNGKAANPVDPERAAQFADAVRSELD
jgi:membrane complex biogenesis BtpA family protein